jgi:flagellar hook-associated protein 2
MLAGSGNSSTTGILSLAAKSNSTIESTLNKDITREEALISTEKTSLTSELNKANEVLQEIPMRMKSVDELYSAVTGYKGS